MVDASELFDAPTPMGSDLQEGVRTIALNQKIRFKLYGRVVLPADGYIFWVRAPLLKQKAFQPSGLVTAAELSNEEMEECEFEAMSSLHYTTDFRQEETENYAANRILLTTKDEVQQLNDVAADSMWIGEHAGMRFGFSAQAMRYFQAGLWHYSGMALFADMQTQVIDRVQDFAPDLVVSNSLPAWLALQRYSPPWVFWKPLPTIFPSFLVPDNEPPPYAVIHIEPDQTQALAAVPTFDPLSQSQVQLSTDTVKITLWGLGNLQALDFVGAALSYCENSGVIGLMNVPSVRDEKRTQAELRIIAKKKSVTFQVSYLQGTMRTVAKQVIKSCVPNLYVDEKRLT